MRYHVFKADKHHYRVYDTIGKKFVENSCRFLTVYNPLFLVDVKKMARASSSGFKNSGNPMDYFAYIETDIYKIGVNPRLSLSNRVKFNPFRNPFFFREDGFESPVFGSPICTITGNELFTN